MTTLLLIWFLFFYPLLLAVAAGFGAWVYWAGHSGQSPTPTLPTFAVRRGKEKNGQPAEDRRLPIV